MNNQKQVVSGTFVKEGKGILLVKNEGTWILPGGKKKGGETAIDCLYRELKEELPNLELKRPVPIDRTFMGITPHSRKPVQVQVFVGNVEGTIEPAAEISEAGWFTIPINAVIGEITSQIIAFLHWQGYSKRRLKCKF